MTLDLRARIAAIVERDRARSARVEASAGRPREPDPAPGGWTAEGPRAVGSRTESGGTPPRREGFGGPPHGADRNERGFSLREQRIAIDDLGLEVVGRAAPEAGVLAHLGLRGDPPASWDDVLFLDTETTGLSGGTGTYVFLLGTAHFSDGELVLRQHVLHDLAREREFVAAIHAELGRFRACASYNGKCFDLPLLRSRVTLALRAELSVDESHLDLLHPARRLWKDRFGSTTLRQLEESVLDDPRVDDVSGALIPERYFRYLRVRDPGILEPILAHNARDVVSLVRISDLVARAVILARSGRAPDHAPAALALARVFERTGETEAAFCCYESAYADGDLTVRTRAALPYARALERRGDVTRAVTMLETLLALGAGSETWREQAEARLRRLSRIEMRRLAVAG
ncbi:MAG TPA: ribonuclease H-like domain-containing protein [Candidatus Limnocylindria bacterium]|nr:ribonuclease H-like domain-containing protein [Candidatus Limnocylindria bacterium]